MANPLSIKAGDLRNSLTLQNADEVRDSLGGFSGKTWSTISEFCAAIRPLTTLEKVQHAQMEAIVSHEITSRFQTGVLPDMRFLFNSREFYIVSVLNVEERNRVLKILVKEKVNV